MYEIIKEVVGLPAHGDTMPGMMTCEDDSDSDEEETAHVEWFAELFAGLNSPLTQAVKLWGINTKTPIDIVTSGHDLMIPSVVQDIQRLLKLAGTAFIHSANPCTYFSCTMKMNAAKWATGTRYDVVVPNF